MHCWNYNILVGQHLCPWPCGNAQNCTPWFIYFILFCYFYFVVFFFFLQWNGTWDFQSNRRFPHSASAARICFLLWLAHLIVSVNLVRRTFHYWFAFICIFIVVVLFSSHRLVVLFCVNCLSSLFRTFWLKQDLAEILAWICYIIDLPRMEKFPPNLDCVQSKSASTLIRVKVCFGIH